MRAGDREPSTARRCAQLRQQIRLAGCVHPKHALSINLLRAGGFIEFCADCMRVTDVHEPDVRKHRK